MFVCIPTGLKAYRSWNYNCSQRQISTKMMIYFWWWYNSSKAMYGSAGLARPCKYLCCAKRVEPKLSKDNIKSTHIYCIYTREWHTYDITNEKSKLQPTLHVIYWHFWWCFACAYRQETMIFSILVDLLKEAWYRKISAFHSNSYSAKCCDKE